MPDDFDLFGGIVGPDPRRREHVVRTLRLGIYRREDGEIFRVRLNRSKTRKYTQRWTRRRDRYAFVRDADAILTLTPGDLLPLDEAREISRQAGQCLACAALLTDPQSQAAGIGPVCARSWTYAEAERVVAANLHGRPATLKTTVRARAAGDPIIITSRFDDAIGIIKTFPGYAWDERSGSWSLPREHALDLSAAFEAVGIAHDEIAAIGMGWDVAS